MNAQGLANVAWAHARLEHHPGAKVLDDIAAGLERELRESAASRGGASAAADAARCARRPSPTRSGRSANFATNPTTLHSPRCATGRRASSTASARRS